MRARLEKSGVHSWTDQPRPVRIHAVLPGLVCHRLRDAVDGADLLKARAQAQRELLPVRKMWPHVDLAAMTGDHGRTSPDARERQIGDRGGVPLDVDDVRSKMC